MTMLKPPPAKRTRRRNGAGYSIPAAADELNVSYKTLRTAIGRGQARTIEFGGQERMTQHEVNRLRELFSGSPEAAA
jgi:transposase